MARPLAALHPALARLRWVLVAAVASGAVPTRARAEPAAIEEIIVTAQKREQRLQDVPISLSVVDGDFLARHDVTDLGDAARYVANAQVLSGGGVIVIPVIRGLATGTENKAFEQAVGLNIDGAPYGRSPYFDVGMFDLERIEVLRGPQGQLFGTNATAGVFNITTRNPTDELTGYLDGKVGNDDAREVTAALGGPLLKDFVNVRLAGMYSERGGTIRNTTAALVPEVEDRLGAFERKGIRAKLAFPDVFGANAIVSWERVEAKQTGTGDGLNDVPSTNVRNLFLSYDPATDFEPRNFVTSVALPEKGERVIERLVANAGYDLGGWMLAGVADHSRLESDVSGLGAGATPLPILHALVADDNPQTTFELRVSSPRLGGSSDDAASFGFGSAELLAGVFYQRREIADSRFRIGLYDVNIAELQAAANAPEGAFPLTDRRGQGFVGPTETTEGLFEQEQRTVAGFGQLDWRLREDWTLIFGLRLQSDDKDGRIGRTFSTCPAFRIATSPCPTAEIDGVAPLVQAVGFRAYDEPVDRSEFQVAPKVSLQYAWSWGAVDEAQTYFTWARGFRNGGLNEFSSNGAPETLTFEDESVHSWELGTKTTLLGGSARFDVALFRMDIHDLQIFEQIPDAATAIPITAVANAPKARSQGVEVDFTWLPSSWLTVRDALGFDDARYVDFPKGPCLADRQNTDGDGDPLCDLSGRPLTLAPKWFQTVTADVDVPLGGVPLLESWSPASFADVAFRGGVNVAVMGRHFYTSAIDERQVNPATVRVDANLGLANAAGWQLRFLAKNLTNEAIDLFGFTVPGANDTLVGLQDLSARAFVGEFRWEF